MKQHRVQHLACFALAVMLAVLTFIVAMPVRTNAEESPEKVTLTFSGENCTIYVKGKPVSGTITAGKNDNITFTVKPNSGYVIRRVIIGDVFLTTGAETHTFIAEEDMKIHVVCLTPDAELPAIPQPETETNPETAPTEPKVKEDTKPPVISEPERQENSWSYGATYAFTVTDDMSGVASVSYRFEDGEEVILHPDTEGVYRFVGEANGDYYITAIDGKGNSKTLRVGEDVIDGTPPEITEMYTTMLDPTRYLLRFFFRAVDDQSGINQVYVTHAGTEIPVTEEDGLYSFDATANSAIQIVVTDALGNSTKACIGNYNIDGVNPVIESIQTQQNWDAMSNVVSMKIYDNSNHVTVRVTHSNGREYEVIAQGEDVYTCQIDANGSYLVTAQDASGNITRQGFVIWHIDDQAPSKPSVSSSAGGTWTSSDVTVTVASTDGQSGVSAFWYSGSNSSFDRNTWLKLDSGSAVGQIVFSDSQNNIYYIVAEDASGNISEPAQIRVAIDKNAPEQSVLEFAPNGVGDGTIYNSDIQVAISAKDASEGCSGIKSVTYRVLAEKKVTQSGTLYPDGNATGETVRNWSGSVTISSHRNAGKQVVLEVTVTDKLGHKTTTTTQSGKIMFDLSAPSVTAEYDNNSSVGEVGGVPCFNKLRTLTVTVEEVNFDPKLAKLNVVNTSTGEAVSYEWTSRGNKHTAVLILDQDGHYTINASIVDKAGNKTQTISFAKKTTGGNEFILDRTGPIVHAAFTPEGHENVKYFSEPRWISVKVTDDSFSPELFTVLVHHEAVDGSRSAYQLNDWQSDGNIHTVDFQCQEDGTYSITFQGTDALGNAIKETVFLGGAADEWVIDRTLNVPVIDDVITGAAYAGEIRPVISVTDANLQSLTAKLYRTLYTSENEDVTDIFLGDDAIEMTPIDGGLMAVLDVFAADKDMDAIYRLEVIATDLAGNVTNSEVSFAVCRFGSVYIYNDYLNSINGQYIQALEDDLVFTEINPAGIVSDSTRIQVTRDGIPVEDLKYELTPLQSEEEKWAEYEYRLSKSNFAEAGAYTVVVSTEDEAGNLPENTDADTQIAFSIDHAAPELTSVTGLENTVVEADSLTVAFSAMDNVAIDQVEVYLNDQQVEKWTDVTGYEFTGSFRVPADTTQKVRIVIYDKAGNVLDTDSDEFEPGFAFHDTVTVSTNAWIRFCANKPLLYSSFLAAAALILVFLWWVSVRMRKKQKQVITVLQEAVKEPASERQHEEGKDNGIGS